MNTESELVGKDQLFSATVSMTRADGYGVNHDIT
jgi:hypothetical protein